MSITKEFKELVVNDIQRISDIISSNSTTEELLKIHKEIDSKYQSCITNWYQGLNEAVYQKGVNSYIEYYYLKSNREAIKDNLSMFKSKLEIYTYGMNAIALPESQITSVNVTTNVNISITFEQARAKIEDMTSLTDEQTKEALDKLSEIESVVNGKDSKKSKWEKIKPILSWLADKSFDLAMTLLPLLLQVKG